MSALTCAVTGANGFVGKNIVRKLQAAGWRVIALVRHAKKAPAGIEARRLVLGEPVAPETFKGVDVLVHAAYDFSPRNWAGICRVNVVGSEYVFDAAMRAGVKRQIFISSMSAFEGGRSDYGRGKLVAENAMRARGGVSIRPGMIYSAENGGIAAQIAAVARASFVIPMIGNGRYPLYTCHIDDLCALVLYLAQAETPPASVVPAANASPVTLFDVADAATGEKMRIVLAIPPDCVAAGLWLLERIGLRPRFRSDSVRSLVHANPDIDFSAAQKMPVSFRPFEKRAAALMYTMRTIEKIAVARVGYRAIRLARRLAGKSDKALVKRSGITWELDLSQVIDFCIYLFGGFEVRTINVYARLIKPGDVVIDVGANIGAHTLPMAKLAGDTGKVVAFEPTAFAFGKLRRNISLNPQLASRIRAVQAMLTAPGDDAVEPEIYSNWPLESSGAVHEVHRGKLESTSGASALTLDEAVAAYKLPKVDFIKIDVDGHEFRVLSGALATLKKFKPVVIMEVEPYLYLANPQEFDGIFSILQSLHANMSDVLTGKPLPLDAEAIKKTIPYGTLRNVLIRF